MKFLLLIPVLTLTSCNGLQLTVDVPIGEEFIPVTIVLPEK